MTTPRTIAEGDAGDARVHDRRDVIFQDRPELLPKRKRPLERPLHRGEEERVDGARAPPPPPPPARTRPRRGRGGGAGGDRRRAPAARAGTRGGAHDEPGRGVHGRVRADRGEFAEPSVGGVAKSAGRFRFLRRRRRGGDDAISSREVVGGVLRLRRDGSPRHAALEIAHALAQDFDVVLEGESDRARLVQSLARVLRVARLLAKLRLQRERSPLGVDDAAFARVRATRRDRQRALRLLRSGQRVREFPRLALRGDPRAPVRGGGDAERLRRLLLRRSRRASGGVQLSLEREHALVGGVEVVHEVGGDARGGRRVRDGGERVASSVRRG